MTRRNAIPIGPLLGAVGAIMLVVSLCLDWYEDITGFTVFEALDLVLVGLAFLTIVSLAGGLGTKWPGPTPRPVRSLAVAIVTVLIVVSQLLNDPPAVAGSGGPDHAVGIWLALGGAGLMVVGALAAVGHVSFAVDVEGEGPRSEPAAEARGPAATRSAPGAPASATDSSPPAADPDAPTSVDAPKREDG